MSGGISIGAYRVVRRIGEGGMGTVFLGEHVLIGRCAAIKMLRPELMSKPEAVDRFFNEARAMTAISDPGIVQVFDFGVTPDNVAYIVMELLEGEPLNLRLRRQGALAPADALRITRQVAGSLGAMHAAGIVHRDLKPENLYMIRDPEAPGSERPKILDFGIAKLSDGVPGRVHTRTGVVMGTPLYMSPEQCDGAEPVDHRADIYALGCVLFHLLTGRPPFDLSGAGAIMSAHLCDPPPQLSSLAPQLPPELDELVARCLAKSPDERFATILELQQACNVMLARITGGGDSSSATPSESNPIPLVAPHMLAQSNMSQSTLGTSVGQPLTVIPHRRFGLLVAIVALTGGAGSTIAVMTARSGGPKASGESDAHLVVVPDAAVLADRPEAGAVPGMLAPTPSLPEARVIPSDAPATTAAETLDAATRSEPPGRPAAATHKPSVDIPPASSRPKTRMDDLYDDRD